MDIDIDDILADLDRDTTAVDHTFTSQGNDITVLGNDEPNPEKAEVPRLSPVKDFDDLTTHWRNERMCPELLPYPHLLMARMLRRVQEQMEHIECLSMGFLDDESNNSAQNIANKLPLLCMEADLERLKFVLRSYIRCRLFKIDKQSLYLIQISQTGDLTVPLEELLSKQEIEYHQRHSAILLKLLNSAILRHMPPELQAIDDNDGSVKMVEEPELDSFVFIYVKGPDYPHKQDPMLEVNEEGQRYYPVTIQELKEEVELTIGGIYVMRYSVIRDLLKDRKVILI
ncbi:LAFE_0E02322g1_1 [Lachancea fermentati]|uniref:DNA replication complex GINS protein SLD5 n=1 Tax=Lachancea fermentati TaxID=4955 RepID=A0A1G4MCE1_LACFM|nr:LAFE_0E02322g1_1 [Lachancea fermentati]